MTLATEPLIKADRLTKTYGDAENAVTVLRDISFEITAGEFVAITGPSGSGKSSLMNLIGLLDEPSSGKLRIAGKDTTQLSNDEHARLRNQHIGFIFQSYHLMPRRTALANVELPLIYQGLGKRERRQLAEAALERVNLTPRRHAFPSQMSGGEQQRVAIARALVTDPVLILADEPTGALDSNAGDQVVSLLESACADDRAVMLVTHDPEIAMRASRTLVIRDGVMEHDASHEVRHDARHETGTEKQHMSANEMPQASVA